MVPRSLMMKKKHILSLLVIVVAGIGAYWAGLGNRARAPIAPAKTEQSVDGLAIESASLDLGEVWEQKNLTRQVQIRNDSAEDAIIERFGLGCSSCTTIEPKSLQIAAGETATVNLTIDLVQRNLRDFGRDTRSFSSDFWPVLKGRADSARTSENTWRLQGTIKSRVTVDTPALN